MRDDRHAAATLTPPDKGAGVYRFVIVTLDAHAAGPAARIAPRLSKDFPASRYRSTPPPNGPKTPPPSLLHAPLSKPPISS